MKVVFVSQDGSRTELEAQVGTSLMAIARANNIQGVAADCGGCASCSTCHVYVTSSYADLIPEMGEHEDVMLENTAADRRSNSRLSCQIIFAEELDGITVEIPERQY